MLVPYDIIQNTINGLNAIRGIDNHIQNAQSNNYEHFLRVSDLHKEETELQNFADFLPRVSEPDTMKLLEWDKGYDNELLFAHLSRNSKVLYQILSTANLSDNDIAKCMRMRVSADYKGMLFPQFIDVDSIRYVLKRLPYSMKMDLFNEYVCQDGNKTFVELKTKGHAGELIQAEELMSMLKKDAYKMLTGKVSPNSEGTVVPTLNEMIVRDFVVFNAKWTPNELYNIVKTDDAFFQFNNFVQDSILRKLKPSQRNAIVFSDTGIRHMEYISKYSDASEIKYLDMLLRVGVVDSKHSSRIFEYRKKMFQRIKTQKETEMRRKENDTTFAGNYTPVAHQEFIMGLIKGSR